MKISTQQRKSNAQQQWDAYWAQGNITSLASAFEGTYEGAIAAFWRQQVDDLPDGSHIVDLGTGNAALPILFYNCSQELGRRWDISGVDLANISKQTIAQKHPEYSAALDQIRLLGRTSMTRLPMPDASAACVTGQFAIEYAPVDEVLVEVARILQPEGRAAFIMHHPDSVILKTSLEEKEQARLVFEEHKLLVRAKSLIRAMGDAKTPEALARLGHHPATERKRHLLNQALAALQRSGPWHTSAAFIDTAIGYVAALFDEHAMASEKEKLAMLQKATHELRTNLQRIEDLLAASKNKSDMERFVHIAEHSGLMTELMQPFQDTEGRLIGWAWLLCKKDPNGH